MIALVRLCDDLFVDSRRSLEDTSSLLRDHLTRLTAYPHGGAFDGMIASTQALVDQWAATELSVNTGQSTQQGGYDATQDQRDAALNRLRRNYSALDALEDERLRERLLRHFYPQGLEQYNAANIDTLPPLLDAYQALMAPVRADLPPDFETRTATALAPFVGARARQVGQQAGTTRAREQRRELVDDVTSLLTDNYHFLSLHFRAERGQVVSFFNRRYLGEDAPEVAAPVPVPVG